MMKPEEHTAQFRYPGAQPFTTDQQHIFFGRDQDIRELFQLITLEPLVVLHSKSGLGKTSLLNAGVIPLFLKEKKYVPVNIRFGAFTENKTDEAMPLDITRSRIGLACEGRFEAGFLDSFLPDDGSLWYLLTREKTISGGKAAFLLVFDQFEELFTYPEAAIRCLKEQLAELLHTQIPERFRSAVEQEVEAPARLQPEQLDLLHEPLRVKVVLAIRSDRISALDQLTTHLPGIKQSWYELDALTEEQAEEAILNPAYEKGNFVSPPFDFEDEVMEEILGFLTKKHEQKIESFQLQILCQSIERKVIQQRLNTVTLAEVGNIQEVYENYYEDQVRSLDNAADQQAARRFIEDGLIFEEEQRRLSLYEGQIHKDYGVPDVLLRRLVNTHLVRREPSVKGGYLYELSHDTLVVPVLKAKARRQEEERLEALKKSRLEREQMLKEERRKRRRNFRLAVAGFFLALLSIAAMSVAIRQAAVIRKEQQNTHAALKKVEAVNEDLEASNQQIILEKQKSDEAKIAAEQAEQVALLATEIANFNKEIAEKAEAQMTIAFEKAEASRQLAELQRDSIGRLKVETEVAKDKAERGFREAEKQRSLAESAARKAYDLGRIAQSRSLALKSLETGRDNPEQKAQLALIAYETNFRVSEENRPAHPPDVFKALYESVRQIVGDESHNRLKISDLIVDAKLDEPALMLTCIKSFGHPVVVDLVLVQGEMVRLEVQKKVVLSSLAEWQSSVASSDDGHWMALAGKQPEVQLYDLAGGKPIVLPSVIDLPGDLEVFRSVFHPDEKRFFFSASDNRVYSLSVDDWSVRAAFSTHAPAEALARAGKWLLTGDGDGQLLVHDLQTGELSHTHHFSTPSKITALQAFIHQGTLTVAAGLENGTIYILKQQDRGGQLVETDTLQQHNARISSLVFDQQHTMLAASSFDGSASVIFLDEEELPYYHLDDAGSWVMDAFFFNKDQYLLISTREGELIWYCLDPDHYAEMLRRRVSKNLPRQLMNQYIPELKPQKPGS